MKTSDDGTDIKKAIGVTGNGICGRPGWDIHRPLLICILIYLDRRRLTSLLQANVVLYLWLFDTNRSQQ